MPAVLSLRRLRHHISSFDDLTLLIRVGALMAVLPLLLWLPVPLPRLLTALDWTSRRLAVRDHARASRVVHYCRALGGLHVWSFQDNCVVRSLTLFTLLRPSDEPIEIVFGVRMVASDTGVPVPGRRHVWLLEGGRPLHETEPVDEYIVSMRFRAGETSSAHDEAADGAERRRLWSASVLGGTATGVTVLMSLARAKVVAVMLGPMALGLLGQQATLSVLLSYVATFGSAGGTTRFLSEAVATGDHQRQAGVIRTSTLLQVGASVVGALVLVIWADPLARLAFGEGADPRWALWLAAAMPLTSATALAQSVLRGHRLVVRHSVTQVAASVSGVVAVVALAWTGDPFVVLAMPAAAALGYAVFMVIAAWARMHAALRDRGRWLDRALAGQLLYYGAANVVMSAASAATTVMVGRSLLAGSSAEGVGHFYALAMGGEVLVALVLGGYHTYYYPTFCAAAAGRESQLLLGRLLRTIVLVAWPVLALTALTASFTVPLLLSSSFLPVAPLVGWLVLGVYLRTVAIILGIPLLARGHLTALTVLHLAWTAGLLWLFHWYGPAAGPASWVLAFVVASACHTAVVGAVVSWGMRLRPAAGPLALALGGAATLWWLAR